VDFGGVAFSVESVIWWFCLFICSQFWMIWSSQWKPKSVNERKICQWEPRSVNESPNLWEFAIDLNSLYFKSFKIGYGVASISRLLKIIGLFCKRAWLKRRYSAKETYDFKEPTNRSHPIFDYVVQGGEDPQDALSCRSFYAKEPLIIGLFCRKWPMKIRHPMTLLNVLYTLNPASLMTLDLDINTHAHW